MPNGVLYMHTFNNDSVAVFKLFDADNICSTFELQICYTYVHACT